MWSNPSVLVALIATLLFVAPARAACPSPVSLADWRSGLTEAEARFEDFDTEGFQSALESAQLALRCVDAPLDPEDATRFHLLLGIAIHSRGNQEDARISFAAARAIDPNARIPYRLVPEGHEMHELVERSSVAGTTESVPAAASGQLLFDGTASTDRPSDRPTIAQWVGPDETRTDYLDIGELILDYPEVQPEPEPAPPPSPVPQPVAAPALPVPVPAPTPQPAPVPREKRGMSAGRALLLAGSGVALATAGVLYARGGAEAQKIAGPHPPETTLADLRATQDRANTFVVGSGIAGGVGAIAFVGFVVVR